MQTVASHGRGVLLIRHAEHFLLAVNAIQKAGLALPGDVSLVEFDGYAGEVIESSGCDRGDIQVRAGKAVAFRIYTRAPLNRERAA